MYNFILRDPYISSALDISRRTGTKMIKTLDVWNATGDKVYALLGALAILQRYFSDTVEVVILTNDAKVNNSKINSALESAAGSRVWIKYTAPQKLIELDDSTVYRQPDKQRAANRNTELTRAYLGS
jgi:hypothetical protein